MNKKRKIILIIIPVIIAVGILTCVLLWMSSESHQSEIAYATTNSRAVDEAGVYYINSSGYLVYMDAATGETVPVCSRADCTHDTADCDACYSGLSGYGILVYDDSIYISYFTHSVETEFENYEFTTTETVTSRIEVSDKDGSNRKIIYEAESGAVLSMLALDGKLYYTAYTSASNVTDDPEYKYCDNTLYCYDMDWGSTKELLGYEGSENYYGGGLYLLSSTDEREKLYLENTYSENQVDEADTVTYSEYMVVDLEGNEISSEKIVYDTYNYINVINILDGKALIAITSHDETKDLFEGEYTKTLYECDAAGNMTEVFSVKDGDMTQVADNYWLIIKDESEKVLIDTDNDIYYISKSTNSDNHIVPDIYVLDGKNDMIYYDATDYTGVDEGTVYFEDPTQPSCMKLSDFLEAYFYVAASTDEIPEDIVINK